jgi:hypothetical protein
MVQNITVCRFGSDRFDSFAPIKKISAAVRVKLRGKMIDRNMSGADDGVV